MQPPTGTSVPGRAGMALRAVRLRARLLVRNRNTVRDVLSPERLRTNVPASGSSSPQGAAVCNRQQGLQSLAGMALRAVRLRARLLVRNRNTVRDVLSPERLRTNVPASGSSSPQGAAVCNRQQGLQSLGGQGWLSEPSGCRRVSWLEIAILLETSSHPDV